MLVYQIQYTVNALLLQGLTSQNKIHLLRKTTPRECHYFHNIFNYLLH